MDIQNKKNRSEAMRYVGNQYQIGGTRHYRLTEGYSNGCRCIDVRTGSGFEYTIVCDRGLDISLASYKGTNLAHLTNAMESNPAFYNSHGIEWLRTFSAGLLTTCGPNNISSPCVDDGEELGQHGRWSTIPGEKVCDLTNFDEGKIEIQGDLCEIVPFGHKLKIHRKITSELGKSSVVVEDTITNEGGKPSPLNVLYHINFGYPLLDENTTVHVPSKNCCGYNEYSENLIHERNTVKSPDGSNAEKNFLHTFNDETTTVWIHNKDIEDGLAFYITFDSKQLPYMTQWALEDVKDYVLALEPANVPCEPRNVLREKGILPFLQPGETIKFKVEMGVIAGNKNIEEKLGK